MLGWLRSSASTRPVLSSCGRCYGCFRCSRSGFWIAFLGTVWYRTQLQKYTSGHQLPMVPLKSDSCEDHPKTISSEQRVSVAPIRWRWTTDLGLNESGLGQSMEPSWLLKWWHRSPILVRDKGFERILLEGSRRSSRSVECCYPQSWGKCPRSQNEWRRSWFA